MKVSLIYTVQCSIIVQLGLASIQKAISSEEKSFWSDYNYQL